MIFEKSIYHLSRLFKTKKNKNHSSPHLLLFFLFFFLSQDVDISYGCTPKHFLLKYYRLEDKHIERYAEYVIC